LSTLPWGGDDAWDVAARVVPMQQRMNVAAFAPFSDNGWLGTPQGVPPVLLAAAGFQTSSPAPGAPTLRVITAPTSRDLRAALEEALRAAQPRLVAAVRVVRRVIAIGEEVARTWGWLVWLITWIVWIWHYLKSN